MRPIALFWEWLNEAYTVDPWLGSWFWKILYESVVAPVPSLQVGKLGDKTLVLVAG